MYKEVNNELLESLIGKTKKEVNEICQSSEFPFRTIREDKTNYVITMDLRFDRVNLEYDNGILTRCHRG